VSREVDVSRSYVEVHKEIDNPALDITSYQVHLNLFSDTDQSDEWEAAC
jgi:hypothetical protein